MNILQLKLLSQKTVHFSEQNVVNKYPSIIISAQMHMETIVISLYIIYHQESLVKPAFAFQES